MSSKNKLEYFTGEDGDIYWHVKNTGNHKVVSASSEGFETLRAAMDNYQESLRPVAAEDVTYPEGYNPSEHVPIATSAGSAGEPQIIELQGHDASDKEEDAD